jgi:hypothetical protein
LIDPSQQVIILIINRFCGDVLHLVGVSFIIAFNTDVQVIERPVDQLRLDTQTITEIIAAQ